MDKVMKLPGPNHPIAIEPAKGHVRVRVAGHLIADSRNALTLREASYPPVHYIPRTDVDMGLLERSAHMTYCPYKGDCSYYSIPVGGEKSVNAIWTYEAVYPYVTAIEGYLAFYSDRVDAIELELEG